MKWQTMCVALAIAIAPACADDGAYKSEAANNAGGFDPGFANNAGEGGGDDFVPEVEEEFDFALPAVLGARVYVPNSTLNSVAVIDSRTLAIDTIPVGFEPTRVVGPASAADDAAVYVLNKGSSTVSVIDPDSGRASSVDALRGANEIAASPDGSWALAWYTATVAEEGDVVGDLAAATLIRSDGTASQLAVGFRIERIAFTDDSSSALVLSDDGVSVVEAAELADDALVPPVALLPPDLQEFDLTDREVVLDPAGEWAIARVGTYRGLVLTDLASGEQWRVELPATPTDLDWIDGETPRLLGMLPTLDRAFVADVPDGLIALSGLQESAAPDPDMGMGASDMGTLDQGTNDMGANDVGGVSDMGASDMGVVDVGPGDTGADMTAADAAVDMAADAAMQPDLGPVDPVDGFLYVPLEQPGLGAAEVAPGGTTALIFSTLAETKRAILLDLDTIEQRSLAFEKGVRGAVSDAVGRTFLVLHTRVDGDPPPGSTPADPEYIARSWGVSVVDVASAATRLVLTEREPADASLWNTADTSPRIFLTFSPSGTSPANRDVLSIDLLSFATGTFRVPSQPDGIGQVEASNRIFVNQIHPQGRITFVDVTNDRRQTVTGYQLNSGID